MATHVCPPLVNLPHKILLAIVERCLSLTSSNTNAGDFPPSSRITGVNVSAAFLATIVPTTLLPVYMILSNFCSNNSVVSGMAPLTAKKTSSSRAADKTSLNNCEKYGVCSEGFKTTALPPASAPTTLETANKRG